ncbi:MAG: hypothetical protein IJH39_10490 [Clostridia bacterium]|nr:hypothetical protein [Clostridia bacterium]
MKNKILKFILSFILVICIFIIGFCALILYDYYNSTEISVNITDSILDFGQKIVEGDLIGDIQTTLSKIEGEQNEYSSVDYSNIIVDRYFFNQLEEEAKTIYKAFESNKDNMKTGNYKIELGTTFSDVLSKENGQEELGRYYQSAIEAYTYDNPDIFYINPQKMYLNIETITKGKKIKYNVYINSGVEENYFNKEFKSEEQINETIKKLENVRQAVMANRKESDYDNVKMVHDYLVETIEYDSSVSKENIYNIYGALINKECVCEGYAKGFKYLMDGLNIPCTIVIGKAENSSENTESHAWNYVKIDEEWYAIDVTWDDPVVVGIGSLDRSRKYKYFLLGENEIMKDHMPSGKFTENGKTFDYPTLNKDNYK